MLQQFLEDGKEIHVPDCTITVNEIVVHIVFIFSYTIFAGCAEIRQRIGAAAMGMFIAFNKFDFVPPEKIGIQENRIMRIED